MISDSQPDKWICFPSFFFRPQLYRNTSHLEAIVPASHLQSNNRLNDKTSSTKPCISLVIIARVHYRTFCFVPILSGASQARKTAVLDKKSEGATSGDNDTLGLLLVERVIKREEDQKTQRYFRSLPTVAAPVVDTWPAAATQHSPLRTDTVAPF